MENNENWLNMNETIDCLLNILMEKKMDSLAKGFEQSISNELIAYTNKKIDSDIKSAETAAQMVEKLSGVLMEIIRSANISFFQAGLKSGAAIIVQLLN